MIVQLSCITCLKEGFVISAIIRIIRHRHCCRCHPRVWDNSSEEAVWPNCDNAADCCMVRPWHSSTVDCVVVAKFNCQLWQCFPEIHHYWVIFLFKSNLLSSNFLFSKTISFCVVLNQPISFYVVSNSMGLGIDYNIDGRMEEGGVKIHSWCPLQGQVKLCDVAPD